MISHFSYLQESVIKEPWRLSLVWLEYRRNDGVVASGGGLLGISGVQYFPQPRPLDMAIETPRFRH